MNAYEKLEMLVKARGKKDITKLIRKRVVDKNGHSRYVYVKREDMEKVEQRKKGETEETMPVRPSILDGYIKWFYKSDRDVPVKFASEAEFKEYVVEFLKNREKYTTKKEAGPKSTRTRGKDKGQRKERSDKGQKRVFDPEKMAVVARMFSRETLDIISGIDKKARSMAAELGLSGDKAEKLVAAFHAMPPRRGFDVGKFTANWAEFEKTQEYQAIMEGQDTGGLTEDQKGVVSRVTDRYKDLITREYGMQKDDTRMDELAAALEKFDRDGKAPDAGNMMENWEAFKKTAEFKKIVTGQDAIAPKAKEAAAEEAPKGKKEAAPKFKKVKVDAEGIIDPTGGTLPLGTSVGTRISEIVSKENGVSGRTAGVVDDRFIISDGHSLFLPGDGVDVIREKSMKSLLSMPVKKKQEFIEKIGKEIESGENVDAPEYKDAKKEFVEMFMTYSGAVFDADTNKEASERSTDIGINRIAMKDIKNGKRVYSVGSYMYDDKTPLVVLQDDGGDWPMVVDAEQYEMMVSLFPDAVFGTPGGTRTEPITVFSNGKPVAAFTTMAPKVSNQMPEKFKAVKPDTANQKIGNPPAVKKIDMRKELEKGRDALIDDLIQEAKNRYSGKEIQPTDENISKMTAIAKDPVSVATKTIDWDTRRYLAYNDTAIKEGVWTDGRAMIIDKKFTDEFYPKMKQILEKKDRSEIRGDDSTYPNWQQVIPGVVDKKTMTIDPSNMGEYKPVSPVGFLPNRGAKKSKGGNKVTFGDDFPDMDAQYFVMMRKQYPKAAFYTTGNMREPFLIVEGNTVRGIVMGMKKQ